MFYLWVTRCRSPHLADVLAAADAVVVIDRHLKQLSLHVVAFHRRVYERLVPLGVQRPGHSLRSTLALLTAHAQHNQVPLHSANLSHSYNFTNRIRYSTVYRSPRNQASRYSRTTLAASPTPCRVQDATLVFKALNCLAPPYLVDDCNLISDDIRRLRSAVSFTCAVYQGQGQGSVIDLSQSGMFACCAASGRRLRTVQRTTKTHSFDYAAAPSDLLLLGAVYKLTLLLLSLLLLYTKHKNVLCWFDDKKTAFGL